MQYYHNHPELSIPKVAANIGISTSALRRWIEIAEDSKGSVETRGSGNYTSDEAKKIARLKRKL